jgi:hypothetical protein
MTRMRNTVKVVRETARLARMFLYAILVIAGAPTAWERR